MKIFIAKGESEYKIYKVADHLIEEFKEEKQSLIIIEAQSIQDALIQFSQLDKDSNLSFNSELTKVKEGGKSAFSGGKVNNLSSQLKMKEQLYFFSVHTKLKNIKNEKEQFVA